MAPLNIKEKLNGGEVEVRHMFKIVRLFIVIVLGLSFVNAALAQTPVTPQHSDAVWQASYWNNMTLSGTRVLEEEEAQLNFDWGTGSPHPNVQADHFSARWTRYVYFGEGSYRFTATSDDGIRLWIDNKLVIDAWYDHSALSFTADEQLGAGDHLLVVEYYENTGLAVARLSWEETTAPVQDWRGEYFNNMSLAGSPVVVRDDANIDFNWGDESPVSIIDPNHFSARWTRTLDFPAGSYRFTMTVDDGGRLWVNNHLLIDAWKDQAATTYTGEIFLPGGPIPLKMEYYEDTGLAVAKLSWQPLDEAIQNWRGEYYNNESLSGNPALVRDDNQINFDWGAGSPAPGTIGVDDFSVRWTRTFDLAAGRYRFDMTVDDGGRLWVDNHLLIDAWKDQPATTYSAEFDHAGGPVNVVMAYYEHGGLAVARLSWARVSTSITAWRGEYFNNTSLSGTPALVRDDAQIDFNWGGGAPAPEIGADDFSVRWTRNADIPAGRYRFVLKVDDGARLWVNNVLLIDAWRDQALATYTGAIDLPGGIVPLKLEYYENGGQAAVQLMWELEGSSSASTVVVDDTGAGFETGGAAAGWRGVGEGYGGHLTWTWNDEVQQAGYNWARWYPQLASGQYEVWVFIPDRYTTTASARYTIVHAGGYASRVVDQSANGDRWVSLGTYWFDGDGQEYVSLTDVTGEAQRSRLVAFDAIKWVAT
jgi:hypothetical protein